MTFVNRLKGYQLRYSNQATKFIKKLDKKTAELIVIKLERLVNGDESFHAKIPLIVLPPRSPELNGTVERGNETAKYEFYAQYSAHPTLHILQKKLHEFAHFYNSVRPHKGIGLLTPKEFYKVISMRS